jgi:hypothetical protein
MSFRLGLAAIVGVAVCSSALAVDNPSKSAGIFWMLKVGQKVNLKKEGSEYLIHFYEDGFYVDPQTRLLLGEKAFFQDTHSIVAVGDNCVTLRTLPPASDYIWLQDMTLPARLISAVVERRSREHRTTIHKVPAPSTVLSPSSGSPLTKSTLPKTFPKMLPKSKAPLPQ